MIKIPYEQIIQKIKEKSSLTEEDINSKLKLKMDQLSGLISKEGAAHIIANELGVKLFDEGTLKIKSVYPGMRSVETIGKITNIYETKEFNRKDGTAGKVASFLIADETGRLRIVLWNEQTDKLKDLKEGIVVQIKDGYTKENINGNIELHLSNKSELQITDSNIEVKKDTAERKKIQEIKGTETNVELLATIVQAFDPRFYEVCPQCNKRLKPKDNGFACDTHGEVAPDYSYVLNLVLDDGTSSIRTVFFKNQLANLLQLSPIEISKYKDSPAEFQVIKDELIGKTIRVIGRASKNEMFDRLEFISQLVFPEPDPDEELKKLEKEAEAIE
jgi:replication factor A1